LLGGVFFLYNGFLISPRFVTILVEEFLGRIRRR
jgi:hypothetical protein